MKLIAMKTVDRTVFSALIFAGLAILAFAGGGLFNAAFLSPPNTKAGDDTCDHDICKKITYTDKSVEWLCGDDGTFTWEECNAQEDAECDMDDC